LAFYFDRYDNFLIAETNILHKIDSDTNTDKIIGVVSPANSFGDMQGGIDLAYYNYFGHELEEEIQDHILNVKYGELCVGDAVIILIRNKLDIHMIVAPTMRIPSGV
jgi:O-acetyl-ADP-ribose deacetylase (regulator of RNase III)